MSSKQDLDPFAKLPKKGSDSKNGKSGWDEPHAGARWAEEHIAPKLPASAQGMWDRTRGLRTKKALLIFAGVGMGLGLLLAIGTYLAVVKPIKEAVQTDPNQPFISSTDNGGRVAVDPAAQQEALARAKPPILPQDEVRGYCSKLPYLPPAGTINDSPATIEAALRQTIGNAFKYSNKAYLWCADYFAGGDFYANASRRINLGQPVIEFTQIGEENYKNYNQTLRGVEFKVTYSDGYSAEYREQLLFEDNRWLIY